MNEVQYVALSLEQHILSIPVKPQQSFSSVPNWITSTNFIHCKPLEQIYAVVIDTFLFFSEQMAVASDVGVVPQHNRLYDLKLKLQSDLFFLR